ncbi:MAG: hypothetical protein RL538_534 [Candidatus Parcubacteria bacterium]
MFTISALPLWYHFVYIGILGLIIGSFLNVVIYRLHTGKSLSGNSHCLSCGKNLRALDLIPLVSYLFLRGRCRQCGSYIPVRYFLVELGTALLFLAAYVTTDTLAELLYALAFISVLMVVVVYDIRHFIIPDRLTIALSGLSIGWLVYVYAQNQESLPMVLNTVLGAFAGTGFLFLLWFVSRGRWIGFGDVKLAFPLGLFVGGSFVFSMIVYSFWIGAFISLLLIGLAKIERGKLYLRFATPRLTIKSVVPFAPFLIAGCLLVYYTHFDVLSLFTF